MNGTVVRGTVKWFNDARGYGFIVGADGREFFAHYSDILGAGHRKLEPHQQVEFQSDFNSKGPRARQIRSI